MEPENATNKSEPKSVYFIFHGCCPDGFYCALLMDLFRQACDHTETDFFKAIDDAFAKPYPKKLTMDPTAEDEMKCYSGEIEKASSKPFFYQDLTYYPVIHTCTERDIKRVLNSSSKKDIAIIADVGNLELIEQLHSQFGQIYFADHHLSSLTAGLNDQEYVEKYPNVKYFYDQKHSACKLLYNLLLPTGILQRTYSPDFGKNLSFMVDSVSLGDVNSMVNLPLVHRRIKSGFCSLTDINNFTKNTKVQHLRKIADYSHEVLEELGKGELEEMEKEIKKEIDNAVEGVFEYKSESNQGKLLSLRFLMLYTKSKYRSEIGNFLSQQSKEKGFNPIGLVYVASQKHGVFKCSWRALETDNDSHINMSEICGLFGGGGHRLASGCEMNIKDLEGMMKKAKGIPIDEEKMAEFIEKISDPNSIVRGLEDGDSDEKDRMDDAENENEDPTNNS